VIKTGVALSGIGSSLPLRKKFLTHLHESRQRPSRPALNVSFSGISLLRLFRFVVPRRWPSRGPAGFCYLIVKRVGVMRLPIASARACHRLDMGTLVSARVVLLSVKLDTPHRLHHRRNFWRRPHHDVSIASGPATRPRLRPRMKVRFGSAPSESATLSSREA